jgi:hypothetical protein
MLPNFLANLFCECHQSKDLKHGRCEAENPDHASIAFRGHSMSKTVNIRLAEQAVRRDRTGTPIPAPPMDTEAMNRDLIEALETAMSKKFEDLTVSLEFGASFKLTLEGEWENPKEAQAEVLEIFGEVMDNFDPSGYALGQ